MVLLYDILKKNNQSYLFVHGNAIFKWESYHAGK